MYSYTYGNSNWGDQLTSFNGVTMSYDTLGNPLRYYNGNSYMFTWQKGRMLTKTVNNNVTTTYTYNADGIRIGKNVGGTAVEYVLDGALILAEKHGDDVVRYFYDASGSPVGMILGSTYYLYEKNLQGDIVGIYNTSGTKIVTYAYDAWGNIVSSSYTSGNQTVHDLNPFRYRGYYYDQETGFYYLQSRYYDPATGRFINADGYINANGDFQGFNMYAYCSNNPVMYVDYTGEWSWENVFAFGAALTIGALVVIAIIGSGGSAAPPLLAAIGTIVGSSVTAATVSTVAVGVAITGIATMGFATTAILLEASGKPGKDYVQARNNGQANRWAQEVGYESAESLKADFVGRSNGSKFNMYTDRATGEIILIALETLIEIATSLFRW